MGLATPPGVCVRLCAHLCLLHVTRRKVLENAGAGTAYPRGTSQGQGADGTAVRAGSGAQLPGPSSLPPPLPSVQGCQALAHQAEERAQPVARGYPPTGRRAPHRHRLEAGPCRGEKRRLSDRPDGTPRLVLIAPHSQLDRQLRDPAAPPLLRLGGEGEQGAAPTFWMSVMSTSLMTLFLLEKPDLELSKHR